MNSLSPVRENDWRNHALTAAAQGDPSEMLVLADYLDEQSREEEAAAIRERFVAGIAPRPVSLWPVVATLEGVSEHQRAALYRSLCRPVGILTGGPGTGKSTCLAAIVRGLLAAGCYGLAICAPTGKAAVRVTQALRDRGITQAPLRARTIHQTLGVTRSGRDGRGWGFVHDKDNTLPAQFVLVDEASMLDVDLAASLFTALTLGTHVLLVGDTGQLPPVGHGSPLRDLAAGGVPVGELTEIHRNAGMIVRACAAIRVGKSFETCDRYDADGGANLKHVEAGTPAEQRTALTSILRRFGESGTFDPMNDVQVITPLNTKGEVARDPLNKLLQRVLNPPGGEELGGGPLAEAGGYRIGDKIICLRNQWLGAAEPIDGDDADDASNADASPSFAEAADRADVYLANGEIGYVTGLETGLIYARFGDPRRDVAIPLKREREAADGSRKEEDNDNFALAYAVTGHKMQGSEVPCCIVMIDQTTGAARATGKEWWYTAVSRAQKLCITIGKRKTMLYQARKKALERRKTFLARIMLETEKDAQKQSPSK